MHFLFPQVNVTQRTSVHADPKHIRTLQGGEFFGEKALKGYVYVYVKFPVFHRLVTGCPDDFKILQH